jgi:hypothetical protein
VVVVVVVGVLAVVQAAPGGVLLEREAGHGPGEMVLVEFPAHHREREGEREKRERERSRNG